MNVAELISRLQDYEPDAEIRVAMQPSWPLRGLVANVVSSDELTETGMMRIAEGENPDEVDHPDEGLVWIAVTQVSASSEHPYAPREAWSEAGW